MIIVGMQVINYKEDSIIKGDIKELYLSAFPEEERPPVNMFFNNAKKKDNDLLAFYDNNEFVGFTNLLFYKDICYIFFLGVTPSKRNKGYGSQILQETFAHYPDKTFVLCFEEVDDKYEDNELRKRRRGFYYRNGFKDNELKTCEYHVYYDTVYHGSHKVDFSDYLNLMVHNYGPIAKIYIKKADR